MGNINAVPPTPGKRNAAWERVYRAVRNIPAGRVVTYGQVARMAKLRGGAREAGHAMAAAPKGQSIPWHRVVGAGGRLLIREPLASLQRHLLQSEKVIFSGHHVDMAAYAFKSSGTGKRTAVPARGGRSVGPR